MQFKLQCRHPMFRRARTATSPALCGVLCPGCKNCCYLIVNNDDLSSGPPHVQMTNDSPQQDSNRIQQPSRNKKTLVREPSAFTKIFGKKVRDIKLSEKRSLGMSYDYDAYYNRNCSCTVCGKWLDKDLYSVRCTCGRYSCTCVAPNPGYNNKKLQYAAFCCTGRSTCCKRSINPRECECYYCEHCINENLHDSRRRCSRSRMSKRTWWCWP